MHTLKCIVNIVFICGQVRAAIFIALRACDCALVLSNCTPHERIASSALGVNGILLQINAALLWVLTKSDSNILSASVLTAVHLYEHSLQCTTRGLDAVQVRVCLHRSCR
jgi:hypothetical protein